MGFVKYDDDACAWVFFVSKAEFERFDTKKTVSYLLGADIKVGEKIAVLCEDEK